MNLQDFQGVWSPTRKCFARLGIDFNSIITLQKSESFTLMREDLECIALLMKSGLYIDGVSFKIRLASLKSGKLKTIRKGFFFDVGRDTKNRTVLYFEDTVGDVGHFILKKGKLVDPESPLEFKRVGI